MKITTAHRPGSQRGRARRTGQTVAALTSCALLVPARSHSCRWCRVWPRRAGVLAVTAGIVLLAAACGGSSAGSGGSSNTGGGSSSTAGSAQSQQDLVYAQCMRSHGVADFPDPNPGGGFGGSISSEVQNNPHYGTADSACRHLLPNGGGNKAQQNLSQFLRHAQCMRSHGVPSYPDPNPGVNPRTALEQAGIDPNSPQVQAASRICDRLLPPRSSAGPSQGGGS
jgi:hypothetical protein